jgi:hypothetical protein
VTGLPVCRMRLHAKMKLDVNQKGKEAPQTAARIFLALSSATHVEKKSYEFSADSAHSMRDSHMFAHDMTKASLCQQNTLRADVIFIYCGKQGVWLQSAKFYNSI